MLSLEKRIAITLYYLKKTTYFKNDYKHFRYCTLCSWSSCSQNIPKLSENIGPKIVTFPVSKQDVAEATGHFLQKCGFPQVIGCVDGTIWRIPTTIFLIRYAIQSTVKLCVAYGKFINVEVKWPGNVHDARVFANCDIQNNYSSGKFNLFYKEILPGYDCIPQLLLADLAYPSLPYVMKEYEHCSTNEEVVFNQMLRSTRNTIECAFGNFKASWRILQRPMDIPVDKLPNVMYACFVLHNFCEARKSEIDPVELEVVMQEERRT